MRLKKISAYSIAILICIQTPLYSSEHHNAHRYAMCTFGMLSAIVSAVSLHTLFKQIKNRRTLTTQPPKRTDQPKRKPSSTPGNLAGLSESLDVLPRSPPPPPITVPAPSSSSILSRSPSPITSPLQSVRHRVVCPIPDTHSDDGAEKRIEDGIYEESHVLVQDFTHIHQGSDITATITKGSTNSVVIQATERGIETMTTPHVHNSKLFLTRVPHKKDAEPEHVTITVTSKQPIRHLTQGGGHSIATINAEGASTFTLEQNKSNTVFVTNLNTQTLNVKNTHGCAAHLSGRTRVFCAQPELGSVIDTQHLIAHNYTAFICHFLSPRRQNSPKTFSAPQFARKLPLSASHAQDDDDNLTAVLVGDSDTIKPPPQFRRNSSAKAPSPSVRPVPGQFRRHSSAETDSRGSSGFRTPLAAAESEHKYDSPKENA